MKPEIREKLDRIDELFPPERLEASRERLRRMWAGQKQTDRYPYTYGQMMFSYYDDVHTPEERLHATLDEIIVHGVFNDDYIPSLFPGCIQSTIPTMFGAKEIVKGKDYTCERILGSYRDIERLPSPSLGPGTRAYAWLEMQKAMLDMTDGRIPIHVTDMQGPIDAAGQIWGYDNLFISAYEHPEHFSMLMDKVTEAFILFWKSQKELLGDLFVPTHLFGWNWVPDFMGASLSADSIVMVSPDFFDEFYAPSISAITEALGSLSIHSCGDFSHVLPSLVKIPGLKAVNAGQMTLEQLIAAGLSGETVAIVLTDIHKVGQIFELIREHSLRVDISILDLWPTRDNRFLTPEEMNESSWVEMAEADARIQEYAELCVGYI